MLDLSPLAKDSDVTNKLLSALGLAKRAGKLSVGAEIVLEGVRGGKVLLAILCSDVSEGSEKKLKDALTFRRIPYIKLECDKATLASRLGKTGVAVACGICDDSFVRLIYKTIGYTEK